MFAPLLEIGARATGWSIGLGVSSGFVSISEGIGIEENRRFCVTAMRMTEIAIATFCVITALPIPLTPVAIAISAVLVVLPLGTFLPGKAGKFFEMFGMILTNIAKIALLILTPLSVGVAFSSMPIVGVGLGVFTFVFLVKGFIDPCQQMTAKKYPYGA